MNPRLSPCGPEARRLNSAFQITTNFPDRSGRAPRLWQRITREIDEAANYRGPVFASEGS